METSHKKELFRFGPHASLRAKNRNAALESFGIKQEKIAGIDRKMKETCGNNGKKYSVHRCFDNDNAEK